MSARCLSSEIKLDVLAVLEPYSEGVAEVLAFFRGADEIAQRGFAGDTAAAAELATYIGPDIAAVLAKQMPLAIASDAAGC